MAARVELKSFSVGSFDNNVYILVDPAVGTSVLFDAPTDAERILRELDGTRLAAILMTHTDPDHVQALDEVRRTTGAPVGVHADDADRLPVKPDFFISDGESLEYGGIHLRALHTPGHTPGSLCFVTDGILIAGDTLFPGGPGNTRGDSSRSSPAYERSSSPFRMRPRSTRGTAIRPRSAPNGRISRNGSTEAGSGQRRRQTSSVCGDERYSAPSDVTTTSSSSPIAPARVGSPNSMVNTLPASSGTSGLAP